MENDPGMEGMSPKQLNADEAWKHIRNGIVGGIVAGTVAYLVDYHHVQLPSWAAKLKG